MLLNYIQKHTASKISISLLDMAAIYIELSTILRKPDKQEGYPST
jgi:hypothetical protein